MLWWCNYPSMQIQIHLCLSLYCIAYVSCADHDDRTGYMDAHGWLITSHRTLWWCGGSVNTYPCVPRHNAGNDRHFNFKMNIQYLIVPHSNDNESHRKTFMRNRESDGQNDLDEVVYFNLQAYILYVVTSQKYCGDVIAWACCTHVYVITSHIILVNRAALYSDGARGAHPVMKRWLVLDSRKLCDRNGLPLWCHMMMTSQWDLDHFPLCSCVGGGCLGC